MFVAAAIMFALTAVGGITAATLHLRNTPPPLWVGRVHGTIALASIVVLAIGVGQHHENWGEAMFAGAALVMFFVAATLGRVLFSFHMRKGTIPRGAIAMHASAAVTALLLLLFEIFRSHPTNTIP